MLKCEEEPDVEASAIKIPMKFFVDSRASHSLKYSSIYIGKFGSKEVQHQRSVGEKTDEKLTQLNLCSLISFQRQ